MNRRPLLFLTVQALLAVLPSSAAEPEARGAVSGHVVSLVTERPIAGASVTVDEAGAQAVSDTEGRFRIADVPIGLHHLQVAKNGFLPRREADVVVTAGRDTVVALKLQDAPSITEEV